MEIEKILFWVLTSGVVLVVSVGFFFAKQFITDIKRSIDLLFEKMDNIVERLEQMAKATDVKDIEKRVRELEHRMDICEFCNKKK